MNKSLLVFAVVLAISFAIVAADKGGDDNKGTGSGKRRDRDLRFNGDPTDSNREIKFDAYPTANNTNVTTRFRFEVKLDGFPRFRVRFYSNNKTDTTAFSFRVGLRSLVEFIDNGSVAGLDPNDTVVSRFSLVGKKLSWSTWNKTHFTNDTTGINTTRFCVNRTNGNAVFYLCVRVTDGVTTDRDKVALDPNRIKLDIGFKNYPYVSNNTRLALIAFVQSRSTANKGSGETIAVGGDGQLTWVANFSNNGTVYPILPSPFFDLTVLSRGDNNPGSDDDDDDDNESTKAVAFTFNTTDRLKDVLWDPEIGLTDAAVLSSAFTLIVSPLVLVLCALLNVFLF